MDEVVQLLRVSLAGLEPSTPQAQARRVLLFVLGAVPVGTAVITDPLACPNCGEAFLGTRTPYCSEACKEMSAFVRQTRNALTTGMVHDPERQVALGQKLWHLLGGGYPLRLTIMPPSAARQVAKRTGGKCELCGNPASTYDHLGSG